MLWDIYNHDQRDDDDDDDIDDNQQNGGSNQPQQTTNNDSDNRILDRKKFCIVVNPLFHLAIFTVLGIGSLQCVSRSHLYGS